MVGWGGHSPLSGNGETIPRGERGATGTPPTSGWRHLCIKPYPNYSCLSDLRFLRKKLSLDGIEVCDLKKNDKIAVLRTQSIQLKNGQHFVRFNFKS